MRAFHGTTMVDAGQIVASRIVKKFPGLWVTDTFARAARYANAREKRSVDFDDTELATHAAVVEIETEVLDWSIRENNLTSETATSLDQCEELIREGTELKIVNVTIAECDRPSCRCHAHAAFCRGETSEALALATTFSASFPTREFEYMTN